MERGDGSVEQWGQRVGMHPCPLASSLHLWISIRVWMHFHLLNFWSCFLSTNPFPQAWHILPAKMSPLMIFLGLCTWHNDSCEECSISERSGNSIIHRLAATLHKAHCWNTDFNLLVLLRQSSAPAPCWGLAVAERGRGGVCHSRPLHQTPHPALVMSTNGASRVSYLNVLDNKRLTESGNVENEKSWGTEIPCHAFLLRGLRWKDSAAGTPASLGQQIHFLLSLPHVNWLLWRRYVTDTEGLEVMRPQLPFWVSSVCEEVWCSTELSGAQASSVTTYPGRQWVNWFIYSISDLTSLGFQFLIWKWENGCRQHLSIPSSAPKKWLLHEMIQVLTIYSGKHIRIYKCIKSMCLYTLNLYNVRC